MNRNRSWLASGLALLWCTLGCSGSPDEAIGTIEQRSSTQGEGKGHGQDESDQEYTLFEAGPVRPVAVLPSGIVAVANIPNDTIELFKPKRRGVKHCGTVPVGMRPVAVGAVGDDLWVVNHLSDSVSVVDLKGNSCKGRVVQTLLVGDEPRDIVSARGADHKTYVFVTTAHRGQNVKTKDGAPRDPELSTPGMGRADVFVFDVDEVDDGQTAPSDILTFFSDTPRALAVGDGKVYAAGFHTGNRTSIVKYQFVIGRGRTSLAQLDADGDFVIDEELPPDQRIIEGGYPAIRGDGRCISAQTSSPPGAPLPSDFFMDVCVQTDPNDPTRALSIVQQQAGVVNDECSCTSAHGELQPTPALIVRFFDEEEQCGDNYSDTLGGCWLEPPHNQDWVTSGLLAQAWNDEVAFSLPDQDVFTIELGSSGPRLVPDGAFSHVGTVLFNMAVHPKTGEVFVANTEALNFLRFEGPDEGVDQAARFANTTVRGHFVENRISVISPASGSVKGVHLNNHIDFDACCEPTEGAASSLAIPLGMHVTQKRNRRGHLLEDQDLYVAALGSDKVAVLSTARLSNAEPGEVVQDESDHIDVPGGPAGLAVDERRNRLYVLSRFSNELTVVDTNKRRVIESVPMRTPEPPHVIEGRRFLYDARLTSSNGTVACASCHVFGDFDSLSWDLGAPDAATTMNEGPFVSTMEQLAPPLTSHFLSVKGPMTTQSLRGLDNHGSMHWRGDRRGTGPNEQPNGGAFDEQAAFNAFNVAIAGLNGRSEQLEPAEMQKFTDFALEITYPPNPIRSLDDVLTPSQVRGLSLFFGCDVSQESAERGECLDGRNIDQATFECSCVTTPVEGCPPEPQCDMGITDNLQTCHGCHRLDPNENAEFGIDKPGVFGTNAEYSSDGVNHIMKVPHFRNMYQKVGMFGTVQTPFGIGLADLPDSVFGPREAGLAAPQNAFTGDQVRGFGFLHSGEEDTMFHFMASFGFIKSVAFPGSPFPLGNPGGFEPSLPGPDKNVPCFDETLADLNARFLDELASPEVVAELQELARTLADPASPPEEQVAALIALTAFVDALPDDNPGAIFKQLGANQLTLPLAQCPALPDGAALEAQGCFDLDFFFGPCAPIAFTVRNCAQWAATLERVLETGTSACAAEGLGQRVDLENLLFAFDTNMKPIVGQQVTIARGADAEMRARLELLVSQADAGNCDLIASYDDVTLPYVDGRFERRGPDLSPGELVDAVRHLGPVTFTAVPPTER